MEQLIAFVMDNFYVVMIIVGVVYSLFFRKSPKRPTNPIPDLGGSNRRRPRAPGEANPNTEGRTPEDRPSVSMSQQNASHGPVERPARSESHQRDLMSPSSDTSVHALLGTAAEHQEEGAALPVRVSLRSTGGQPQQPQLQQTQTREAALSRDDLSRAIMWAEILGPPRARKPHRR